MPVAGTGLWGHSLLAYQAACMKNAPAQFTLFRDAARGPVAQQHRYFQPKLHMAGWSDSMDAERKIVECLAALGLVAVFTAFMSGCHSTGVVRAGRDSYYLVRKDGSPGLGVSIANKAAVYNEADTFCRKKGLEVKTLNETVTPASPGQPGSTELQFKCVPL